MTILEVSTTIVVEPEFIPVLKTLYQRLFAARVSVDTEWYVVFDFDQGSFAIMTAQHPWQQAFRGGSLNVNLRVENVDACYTELQERGAPLDEAPSDKPYGVRSFAFRDPAGVCWYVFRPLR